MEEKRTDDKRPIVYEAQDKEIYGPDKYVAIKFQPEKSFYALHTVKKKTEFTKQRNLLASVDPENELDFLEEKKRGRKKEKDSSLIAVYKEFRKQLDGTDLDQ